jgi:hypothetical protein
MDQFEQETGASVGLLRGAAEGTAPSVAAVQQQQGLEEAMRSQMAMAARARGAQRSLGLRSAGMNVAQMQQQGVQNAAMLRAQEMAVARNAYAQAAAERQQLAGGLDIQRQAAILQARRANQDAALAAQQSNQRANLEASGLTLNRNSDYRRAIMASLGNEYDQRMALTGATVPEQTAFERLGTIASRAGEGLSKSGGSGWGALAGAAAGGVETIGRDDQTGRVRPERNAGKYSY